MKRKDVLNQLEIKLGIHMRDSQLKAKKGILNLHRTRGTHWVLYINEF